MNRQAPKTLACVAIVGLLLVPFAREQGAQAPALDDGHAGLAPRLDQLGPRA